MKTIKLLAILGGALLLSTQVFAEGASVICGEPGAGDTKAIQNLNAALEKAQKSSTFTLKISERFNYHLANYDEVYCVLVNIK